MFDNWQTLPAYQFLYEGDLEGIMTIDGHKLENSLLEIYPVFPIFDFHLFRDSACDSFNMQTFCTSKSRDDDYIGRWVQRYTECLRRLTTSETIAQAIPDVPQHERFFEPKST